MITSNYNKQPTIEVSGGFRPLCRRMGCGLRKLKASVLASKAKRTVLTVECYTGVFEDEIGDALQSLNPARIISSADAFWPADEIDRRIAPFNGGDDPLFGWMSHQRMAEFINPEKAVQLAAEIEAIPSGLIIVIGSGATLIHPGDLLVYADLARWEAQLRMRRNEISNMGVDNKTQKWSLQYKRAYFIDWRGLRQTEAGTDAALGFCAGYQPAE